MLSIDLRDGFNSAFDYQFTDGDKIAAGFTSGNILALAADAAGHTARRALSLNPGGTGLREGNLLFQVVSSNFRARLELLEERNRVTALAAPVLLTANNEVSRLFVGEERPIVRSVTSQSIINDNTVTAVPNTTIDFRPVGTTLLVTPSINSDRTVTLRVLQETSSINAGGATIPVIKGDGTVQNLPVDVVQSRSVSGTVVAKDGLMVAVGGLIEETRTDLRAGVPWLSRIPGLGFFFRRQTTGQSRRELVILLRPLVLSTPAEGSQISQNLVQELSANPKVSQPGGTLNTFPPAEVPSRYQIK